MNTADTYLTIAAPALGEYREKGSKFLAFAYPVFTGTDIRTAADVLKKEHFKAHHHCYAYRLGLSGNLYRANDDGEPSGTAGKPILGQIDSFGLTNVLIIVVRYFGGIKLGTSGLTQAYKIAARTALETAQKVERTLEIPMQLVFDYAQTSDVLALLKTATVQILHQQYDDTGSTVQIVVRLGEADALQTQLEKIPSVAVQRFNDLPFQ